MVGGAELLARLEVAALERERLFLAAREDPAARAAIDAGRLAHAGDQRVELVRAGPVEALLALAAALPVVAEAAGRGIGSEGRAEPLAALARDAARLSRERAPAARAALSRRPRAGHGAAALSAASIPAEPALRTSPAAARRAAALASGIGAAASADTVRPLVGTASQRGEQDRSPHPEGTSNQYLRNWAPERAILCFALTSAGSRAPQTGTQVAGILAEMALASVRRPTILSGR